MTRVVLIEDHNLIRHTLRRSLEDHQIEVVGESQFGKDAIPLVEKTAPDIVLLDLALPDIDGLYVLREMRIRGMHTPVMILTASGTSHNVRNCMEAGANGFITKIIDVSDLVRAIRTVISGGVYIEPTIPFQQGNLLTPRQFEILEGVVRGRTNDAIATNTGLSVGTIKREIQFLLKIFRCEDRTHLACEAALQGIIRPEK